MPLHPQILIFDVDDTVAPSTMPVESDMARALEKQKSKGRELVFISGGTIAHIHEQVGKHLDAPSHLLGSSGTQYALSLPGKVPHTRYQKEMAQAQKERVLAAVRELVSLHSLQPLTEVADQIQDRGAQVTLSVLGRHAPDAAKRSFDPDGSRRKIWAEELRTKIGTEFWVVVGGTSSLDITLKGFDKGWGVQEFIKHMGWKANACRFYGDRLNEGGNDFPVRGVLPDCVEVSSPADTLAKLKLL